jgi:hypothetical protein
VDLIFHQYLMRYSSENATAASVAKADSPPPRRRRGCVSHPRRLPPCPTPPSSCSPSGGTPVRSIPECRPRGHRLHQQLKTRSSDQFSCGILRPHPEVRIIIYCRSICVLFMKRREPSINRSDVAVFAPSSSPTSLCAELFSATCA